MELILPKNETRTFTGNKLKNGVKFINVEDKDLDKSRVMVSVNIGSLGDPVEYQGLAHFLEHMLFLGSKKYPEEDSFEKFLNENGGSSNAYTDTFETVYYFSVFNNKLEEAIDMFSRFFIDPLFDKGSVDREINAIASEHSKNIQQDNWRLYHFIGLSSKKDGMLNKFGTGNLESLQKEGNRDRMISFYNQYYVSSNINIVTLSSLENNKVQQYIEKSFLNIPEKHEPKLKIEKPFFDNKNQSFFLKSISKNHSLVYYWEIPAHVTNYLTTHSPHLISQVISSDNDKSLKQFLVKKGLIRYLYTEVSDEGVFIVHIQLSKLGNWREVDSYFRYYMEDLKNQDWNKICQYLKKKDQVLFDYSSKAESDNLGFQLVTNLIYYPIKKAYVGPRVIETINLDEIDSLLTEYLLFDRVNMVLSSDEYTKENVELGELETEPYYQLEYHKAKFQLQKPQKFNYEVVMENPFLEIEPKIITQKDDDLKPKLVKVGDNKIWFGNVFKFGESKIYSILSFVNSEFISSIDTYLNTTILLKYINKKINKDFNLASEIGFHTSLSMDINDSIVTINVYGHNDKFHHYFNLVVDYIKDFKYAEEDKVMIETIVDAIKDDNLNIRKSNPWEFNSYLERLKVNPNSYTIDQINQYLESLTVDKFVSYINETKNRFLYQSKFTPFFYGNVTEEMLFGSESLNLSFTSIDKPRNVLKLLSDIDCPHPNKEEKDNYLQYSYLIGSFNPMDNLMLLVLAISISQSFYDQLRTKQQFGYLVSASRFRYQDKYYLVERVQSGKKISEIESAIQKFNKEFIDTVSEDEYNKYVEAAENILNERENSTRELYGKYLVEIIENKFLFNRDELLLRQLKNLSFDKFKEFFKSKVLDATPIKTYIRSKKSKS